MLKKLLPWLALGTLLMGLQAPVYAQGSLGRVEQTESTSNAYFTHVRPGAPTVQVQILGAVPLPGLYEFTVGTKLGEALALAGGPLMGVRFRLNPRTVTVRLFRPDTNPTGPFYEQELEANLLQPGEHPVLADGDILTIEVVQRQGIGWRDIVALVNTAGLLALAIERIRN